MLIIAPGQKAYKRDILSIFYHKKVCCLFSLQYTIFKYIKLNQRKISQTCSYRILSKGRKNEVETSVENESSVFEPLKFYCDALEGFTRT